MRLLWQQLLGTLIPPLLSHAAPSIRAVACDLLCLMPDEEFTRLQVPRLFAGTLLALQCSIKSSESQQARQQAVLLSLLLGLAADCNPQVAASSFRALGALVLLPETAQVSIPLCDLLSAQ
jgi:hypothetical protein